MRIVLFSSCAAAAHPGGAYAPHTLEVGDYGGAAPVIPHFRRSAKRCALRNKLLSMQVLQVLSKKT
ncbi:MAG: hypothetical protein CVV49_02845 [Spirochaetae bacterium HGW-Spirochaetae-5]|nr:MAG: hypothetical protein CVV49_02845 [Spirochaetae bacterium HGW-Spirochaetae-5]